MILLLGVTIIGIILMVTYVNLDRQEIEKKQTQIQRDLESLKESIEKEKARQHEENIKKIGTVEV